MKKYLYLSIFCLIYYWPLEVPVVGLCIGWWSIKKYERTQQQRYHAMPGPAVESYPLPPDGYRYTPAADTVTTGCGGSIVFEYDILTEAEE